VPETIVETKLRNQSARGVRTSERTIANPM
jgi:hypothetical protein